jgi:hypothetical protein
MLIFSHIHKSVAVDRLVYFYNLSLWDFSDCCSLLSWYNGFERLFRKGWNNNLSLMNTDVLISDTTYSLVLLKLEHFKSSFAIILSFKFSVDGRGIIRAYTKFRSIKKDAVVWSVKENKFFDGSARDAVVELLINRIIAGMGWNGLKCQDNLIRRYRLVSILNSPHLHLRHDDHVHHVSGLSRLISGDNSIAVLDDRIKNLQIMNRLEHKQHHLKSGDDKFILM